MGVIGRATALLAGSAAVLAALDPLRDVPAPVQVPAWAAAEPETALTALAALAGWVLALYVCLLAAASLLIRCLPAGRRAAAADRAVGALVPRPLRPALQPLVKALLGSALVLAPAAPAMAAPGPAPVSAASAAAALPSVPAPIVAAAEAPLPPLDWVVETAGAPAAVPALPAPPPGPRVPPTAKTHRVVAGDTLWDLAAQQLGPAASPAAITAAWQQIYAANQTVIGPDPSFLVPGEILQLGATP